MFSPWLKVKTESKTVNDNQSVATHYTNLNRELAGVNEKLTGLVTESHHLKNRKTKLEQIISAYTNILEHEYGYSPEQIEGLIGGKS